MNEQLQNFARQTLMDGLEGLPSDWQRTFKLMYGRKNGKRSLEDTELMPISEVVAEIPSEKLDLAMLQVEASKRKLAV